mgnify:CR=1 FL=1
MIVMRQPCGEENVHIILCQYSDVRCSLLFELATLF